MDEPNEHRPAEWLCHPFASCESEGLFRWSGSCAAVGADVCACRFRSQRRPPFCTGLPALKWPCTYLCVNSDDASFSEALTLIHLLHMLRIRHFRCFTLHGTAASGRICHVELSRRTGWNGVLIRCGFSCRRRWRYLLLVRDRLLSRAAADICSSLHPPGERGMLSFWAVMVYPPPSQLPAKKQDPSRLANDFAANTTRRGLFA